MLPDIGSAKDSLYVSLYAQATQAEIEKWNYTKLKGFCTVKEIINRVKFQHTDTKIFSTIHLERS
jgi:hypothetical protein